MIPVSAHCRGPWLLVGPLLVAASALAAEPAAPGKARLGDRGRSARTSAAPRPIQQTGLVEISEYGEWDDAYNEGFDCFGDGGYAGAGMSDRKYRKWCCLTSPPCGKAFVLPPTGYRVGRQPNWYTRYWPNPYLGQGPEVYGGFNPMVYQPTDTTQLGYSYQTVPTWTYQPHRLPAPPMPYWPLGTNCPGGNCDACQWGGGGGWGPPVVANSGMGGGMMVQGAAQPAPSAPMSPLAGQPRPLH